MSSPGAQRGGIRRDLAAQAVATGMTAVAEFATVFVLARLLGVEGWGMAATALATTTVVFACLDQRWQDAMIRYHTMHAARGQAALLHRDVWRIVRSDVTTGVVACVVAAAALVGYALLREGASAMLAVVPACVGIVTAKNVGNASARSYLRVTNRFVPLAVVTLLGALARCAAVGTVWLAGITTPSAALGMVLCGVAVSAVLLNAAALVAARRDGMMQRATSAGGAVARAEGAEQVEQATQAAQTPDDLRTFLRHSWLSGIGLMPLRELDTMLLGFIAGPAAAGPYQVAKTMYTAADTTLGPLQLALQPRLAAAYHHGHGQRLARMVRTICTWGVVFGCAVVLLVELAGPAVIRALLEERYQAAIPALQVMILAFPFSAALLWVIPLCSAAGRPDLVARASIGAGAVGMALIAAGACVGDRGAAAGFAITVALLLLWTVRLALRSPELAPLLRPTAPEAA